MDFRVWFFSDDTELFNQLKSLTTYESNISIDLLPHEDFCGVDGQNQGQSDTKIPPVDLLVIDSPPSPADNSKWDKIKQCYFDAYILGFGDSEWLNQETFQAFSRGLKKYLGFTSHSSNLQKTKVLWKEIKEFKRFFERQQLSEDLFKNCEHSKPWLLGPSQSIRNFKNELIRCSEDRSSIHFLSHDPYSVEPVGRMIHHLSPRETKNGFAIFNLSDKNQDWFEAWKTDKPSTLVITGLSEITEGFIGQVLHVTHSDEGTQFIFDLNSLGTKSENHSPEYQKYLLPLSDQTLILPPLFHRREDIQDLAQYFLHKYMKASHPIKGFEKDVVLRLSELPWAGGMRELEIFIERATLLCTQEWITCGQIWPQESGKILPVSRETRTETDPISTDDKPFSRVSVSTIERLKLIEALQSTGGNITKTAQKMGIGRDTVYRRMRKYGIARKGISRNFS